MDAEVAQEPAGGERPGRRQRPSSSCLGWLVVAGDLDDEDEQGERDHEEGDYAVEAPGLGVGPRVEGPDDLAAAVRVGAGSLRGQPLQMCALAR